jgi:putative phosphoesterase
MRIGIISDTHDRLARTISAVEILQAERVAAIFHCGDLTGPDIVYACAVLPLYFVFGNNEDDLPALRRAARSVSATCLEWGGDVVLADKRIALTHGHLSRETRLLEAKEPDYLFYGHSHIAADDRRDGIRRINPGALHRADEYSVAVLDLPTGQLRFLKVPR